MIPTKDALLTLIKSVEGTMTAANFALTSAKSPEDTAEPITYSGDFGEVELKFEENAINVNCKAEGTEWKSVAQTLFDLTDETWDDKATKSAANVICEAVSKYYGTECVYAGKAAKATKDGKSNVVDITAPAQQAKKSKKEKSSDSYDIITLTNRMENIFQDLKGEMVNNIEKYDIFLPEEYYGTLVTPRIVEAMKTNDRPVLKKVFNTFNTFYDEGGNDIQSLIVVSILGMNFASDESLLKNCETLMDETLYDAVMPVVTYLKTGKGAKKRIAAFTNPGAKK
ncbi:MAG: hypothetical protein MJ115_05515 [Clostridia bacterium]|nr:hypothetical protein [Clostridia bacterium]